MRIPAASLLLLALPALAADRTLPAAYFPLLEAGAAKVEARLNAEPTADLKALEAQNGWRHFGYAILAPAVLYSKKHAANPRYRDPRMRELTFRIGDLLAAEDEKGAYEPRLDSDWDTYMWLEAYRLLDAELGEARRTRWKQRIERNIALVEKDSIDRLDFPWYQSPFIGTSPNHYAQWAANLYLGGRVFGRKDWEQLGTRILRRFAMEDQSPDGYWGEHNNSGPTTGYNHLTLTGVALYYEYSKDSAVLPALRRSTDFHKNFTYLNGTPADVINDRNRRWAPSAWGQFAFTHFKDGRGYTAFLAGFFQPESLTIDQLGRLAQDALYFHEGASEAAPQEQTRYIYQMSAAPAGIRKSGPWQMCLSGIMSTQAVNNQFYLDRQGHITILHQKLGMIITGANSKRQPELATFSEKLQGQSFHLPVSTRLQMGAAGDRLSLAYNTFFSDIHIPPPSDSDLNLRFVISGKGRPADDPKLTLQLCLKSGETLETASGQKVQLGDTRIELDGLGGWIRHRGWTLHVDPSARLVWPVYPFNPYTNGPETNIEYAVGALSVPLRLKAQPGKYVRPQEQEISFRLQVP